MIEKWKKKRNGRNQHEHSDSDDNIEESNKLNEKAASLTVNQIL